MKRHVSDKAMSKFGSIWEMMGLPLMERSHDKWKAGMRTKEQHTPKELWPFVLNGKPMTGEFLVSSYAGGAYTVVTTATDQWFVLTEELEQGQFIKSDHSATSRQFVFVGNRPKPQMSDGAIRHSGEYRRKRRR
jgi:hypothetical protein